MTPEELIQYIFNNLSDVFPKASYGVYFCTIKQHDGENDKASNLDREDVFRVAIGLNPKTYVRLFGQKPARPGKGNILTA